MVRAAVTTELVDWFDERAVRLRSVMDDEMTERYTDPGSDPDRVARINEALAVDPADVLATVLLTDGSGQAIAHAALRRLRGDWEVKRVIVSTDHRGQGLGRSLMAELERIGRSQGAARLILQTGDRQPEAVALYRSIGYAPIAIYAPYTEVVLNSLCFEKLLG